MRPLALAVLLLCAVGLTDSRGRRKKKDGGGAGGGAGQRSGDDGAELAGLLDSVGVTRQQ